MSLFRKCIAEFIGAFAIVFAGCGAIIADQISQGALGHTGIALTFGLVVMVMVYATGHISGAHFNPAVTVAFSLTRHFPVTEIVPYITAQCLGAATASWLHTGMFRGMNAGANGPLNLGVTLPVNDSFVTALSWEAVLTFFLMFVIMAVATDSRAVGKAAGIAIGATVCLDALLGGPICGASLNPARSFGPALVSGEWSHFGAYVFGPVAGAALAAYTYSFIKLE